MSRRIPFVAQLEHADCGAAALGMVLGLHGRRVELADLRAATESARGGADARSLLAGARQYGLDGRAVRAELTDLDQLERGAILHWELNHFVVLDRMRRDGAEILDPALGRCRVSRERLDQAFTGVAILLRPAPEFSAGGGSARRSVWRYLRPVLNRSGLLGRVILISALLQGAALAVPVMTGVVVDRVVPSADRSLLSVVLGGLLAIVGFQLLATFVRAHLLLALRAHLDQQISIGFIAHLVRLPYAFFLRRSAGDLLLRASSNTAIREILTTGALSTLLDGVLVTLYIALIAAQAPVMAVAVLTLGALQVATLLSTQRANQRLMAESLQTQARAQGYLVQVLAGIETLKAVGAEHHAVERWSNLFADELNASLARGRLQALVDSLTGALRTASPLVILAVGTVGVLDGRLSLGTMLAVSALGAGLLTPLANLITTGLQLQLLSSYMERINDILDTPAEQDPQRVRPAPPLRGVVTLERVRFAYGPEGPDVVDDVSLALAAGESVAVVGRSGSGKSTLANLVLGLYEPTAGRVLYDGLPLAGLEASSVRAQLGIVPQHPFVFGATVRENISLADPSRSLEEVEEAARLAAVHDDIAALPLGYDTALADGGASLSGGQRQRIALARALVQRPAVLVLDEATSALDALTEASVYRNLASLTCTRIVIAHRVSTIAHADRILVMEGGRFVEQGTHAELLSARGRYAALVSAQDGSRAG